MKAFITALLVAICAALAMAASNSHVEFKPIVVSYPKGTPYSEIDELKAAIDKAVSSLQHLTLVSRTGHFLTLPW